MYYVLGTMRDRCWLVFPVRRVFISKPSSSESLAGGTAETGTLHTSVRKIKSHFGKPFFMPVFTGLNLSVRTDVSRLCLFVFTALVFLRSFLDGIRNIKTKLLSTNG
jgi:hypothetical protein